MIKVIGKTGCTHCEVVKEILEKEGVDFEYINFDELDRIYKQQYAKIARKQNNSQFPLVFDGDKLINIELWKHSLDKESEDGEDEETIKIKYFSEEYPRLEKITQGDWIDLRVDSIKKHNGFDCYSTPSDIFYKKGDIIKFGLGIAMELPEGYEAVVVPRSSTFKHWGLIQTNSMGVIDNSYCGDFDEWLIEFIATRDGSINRFDRVCQFRIQEIQPKIKFEEVETLGNDNRGGYGSTGKK